MVKLLNKLKDYTRESLDYWTHQRVGGGGLKVLEEYKDFPRNSDFIHPKHIPHQASWARFRLEQRVRLVGFMIPNEYEGKEVVKYGMKYSRNIFYVVFLDKDHRFYKTEKE